MSTGTPGDRGVTLGAWLVRALGVVLVLQLALFSASTVPGVRSGPDFVVWLDGWLQGSIYLTAALLAGSVAAQRGPSKLVWWLVAVALGLRAAAFTVYLGHLRFERPPPVPSVADAGWLGMCVVLMAALVVLGASRLRRLSRTLVLDAVVGALAVTAVTTGLLWETLDRVAGPGQATAAVATNLAYPVMDITLLIVVVALLYSFDLRPPQPVWWLAAGIVGFAVTDAIFLYLSVHGRFHPGLPIAALSAVSTAVIAASGLVRDATAAEESRRDAVPRLAVPTLSAVTCLLVLVYAALTDVPTFSAVTAAAGLLAAMVRASVSFQELRAVAQVRREARTDELTGLANRRAFNEAFAATLRHRDPQDRLALLILDLDNFKDVNDTLGHHYGDELLTLVAPRLQHALRSGDQIARIGGDEFALLLAGAGSGLAVQVAERLRAGLRRPLTVAGQELVVTGSIGIAVFPDHGTDPAELLRHADLAMYDAKNTRTGQTIYRVEQHAVSTERLRSSDALRRAIDGDELVVHYQPQVSLATGAVVGVEALVRWQHPQQGLLGPASFLPQAETAGLMRLVTLDVVEKSLRQCARWRADGHDLSVAVNLSVTNLFDLGFPDAVGTALAEVGLPGEALVFELTEDLLMADPARGRRVIGELRRAGITMFVDDYGTGYSSLSYLLDLHELGSLKLDRSFVTALDRDRRAEAIVASTIARAASLDLELVAEGVETAEVRDRLTELGCLLAQGYFFSRPVPADQVALDVVPAARDVADSDLRPG